MKMFKLISLVIIMLGVNIIATSCNKSGSNAAPAPTVLPVVTSADVSQKRSAVAGNIRFYVNLDKAGTADAFVNYAVIAGTAQTPKDFTTTAGTVTIAAGKTLGFFDIAITGDSLRQPDLNFTVQLNTPKNCTIGTGTYKGTIGTADLAYLATDDAGYSTPASYPNYKLVWSDEFSGSTINTNDWNFETGNSGFGNHELENYTARTQNAFQSNGKLVIEARSEVLGGSNYTSARMTTQGKRSFKFGRIDIRAKLPVSKGMWPALWMLGTNIATSPWPLCGETDIMELVGLNPQKVQGTLHFANNAGAHDSRGGGYTLPSGDFSQKFHVFSIIWVTDSIQFYVDDILFYTVTNASTATTNYPFNNPSFFIFNVAVGGDWPGSPDATTGFPQRMFVDYVRVFQ